MIKRSVLGTVSEVMGPQYIDFDIKMRSRYSPSIIQKQYQRLPKKSKEIFEGYADGMNARIKEILASPHVLLPKQFIDYQFLPREWTPFEVIMIFVGTYCLQYSDFNTELENMQLLDYLMNLYGTETAWKIFNQVKWINDCQAPTTVPLSNAGSFKKMDNQKKIPKNTHEKMINNLKLFEKKEHTHKENTSKEMKFIDDSTYNTESNAWLVGREKTYDRSSMIMNGPQDGWYTPGCFYEIGLHGAGFDVVGYSPFGYPAIIRGHNRYIAWGSTAGIGDVVDIYEEQLNPKNKFQYWFNGKWQDMDKRTETIAIKNREPITIDIYRTIHGLVIQFDEVKNLVYSRKRSWEGFELDSLMGWLRSTRAKNYAQWRKAAKKIAISVNWYYADRNGNIGYIYTGRYPKRKENRDPRLPISGNGTMEWSGILPFWKNPQVYNPKQGYIVNWNNKPAAYWDSPDAWWLSWGKADRVKVIIDELTKKQRFNENEIWEINRRLSYIDLNIAYFLPFLEKAVEGLSLDTQEVKAVFLLKQWDRYRRDLDGDGYYDNPAQTIFQRWLAIMLKNTLQDDLQDFFLRYASTGYSITSLQYSTNIKMGTKILYHALLGKNSTIPNDYDFFNGIDPYQAVRKSLTETIHSLTKEYATINMKEWKLPTMPQDFVSTNFLGIPQASKGEEIKLPVYMNRGSANHMVTLKPILIKGKNVCPPGESGFVAPDGTRDIHYLDQMELYGGFESKPMLFYFRDVLKNTKSSKILYY